MCLPWDHHPSRDAPFRLESATSATRARRAKPGATIHSIARTPRAGQLGENSTVEDVKTLDFGFGSTRSPARSSSRSTEAETLALKVTIRRCVPSGVGWTANIRASACWPTTVLEPALHVALSTPPRSRRRSTARQQVAAEASFAGTIGLAPAEAGLHPSCRREQVAGAGNMDIPTSPRRASTLYLRGGGSTRRALFS